MKRLPVPQDDLASYGLTAWHGRPPLMGRAHRHNEVELNFVDGGAVTYLFSGRQVTVSAGRLAVFWAAVPHQMVGADDGAMLWWLTLPLARVLAWRLPDHLTHRLLHGYPVVDVGVGRASADYALFSQWHDDLSCDSAECRQIVILEVEARLRRLALALADGGDVVRSDEAFRTTVSGEAVSKAEAIARYIAEHYGEPLRVGAIASAVDLQANYAMSLFRRTFGMSMVEYLTQYRIADAQRLLATTDATVVDIALESGFGSLSRFYAAFTRACGQSPRAYRASVRAPQ